MILSVTLNPSIDRTLFVDGLNPFGTNRVVKTEVDAGGKGINLSRVAHELGAKTIALAFLGGGPGAAIEAVLTREGVPFRAVPVADDTRVNVSIEDGSGEPPTTFNERGAAITPGDFEVFRSICLELSNEVNWACLGGSLPPGVPDCIYAELLLLFREAGCRVAVDADGEPMRLALRESPDLIKPNQEEVSRLLEREIDDLNLAAEAARELHHGGVRYALISMGDQGAVCSCDEGTWIARPPVVEAQSTIGSGDSMIAGFLAAIEDGEPPSDALRLGVAAGAATAMTNGSEIGRGDDIERLLHEVSVFEP